MVRRYSPEHVASYDDMAFFEDGDYVQIEDYEALATENARLAAQNKALREAMPDPKLLRKIASEMYRNAAIQAMCDGVDTQASDEVKALVKSAIAIEKALNA